MNDLQSVESLQEFLLNTPLYQILQLPDDLVSVAEIYGRKSNLRFDGYCPHCKKQTTYTLTDTASIPSGDPWNNVRKHVAFGSLTITCGRTNSHKVRYHFHLAAMKIQKIGQLPSLADIANSEIQEFRKERQG